MNVLERHLEVKLYGEQEKTKTWAKRPIFLIPDFNYYLLRKFPFLCAYWLFAHTHHDSEL